MGHAVPPSLPLDRATQICGGLSRGTAFQDLNQQRSEPSPLHWPSCAPQIGGACRLRFAIGADAKSPRRKCGRGTRGHPPVSDHRPNAEISPAGESHHFCPLFSGTRCGFAVVVAPCSRRLCDAYGTVSLHTDYSQGDYIAAALRKSRIVAAIACCPAPAGACRKGRALYFTGP